MSLPKTNPYWTRFGYGPKTVWLKDLADPKMKISIGQNTDNSVTLLMMEGRESCQVMDCTKAEFEQFLKMCQTEILDNWEDY